MPIPRGLSDGQNGGHPGGRPEKLAPLDRQPSLPAANMISAQGAGSKGSEQGACESMGGQLSSKKGGESGVEGGQAGGDVQVEVDRLRREVKQLRIENRNVYWLDDECKRLKAELETAVLR